MGKYTAEVQPRRTPAFATLVDIAPDGADVVEVRAERPDWRRAELLGSYAWGPYAGAPLERIDSAPDDSIHTAFAIGEFLTTTRNSPAVKFVRAVGVFETYRIELNRAEWEY
ncbi:hypothetical protein [Streptomyces sp. NPDC055607]